EDVAEEPRHGHQDDFAVACLVEALCGEDGAQPGPEIAAVATAVIGTSERHQARAVELQPTASGTIQRAEVEAEIGDAIAEGVDARARAAVDHHRVDDRMEPVAHGVSIASRAAAGRGRPT